MSSNTIFVKYALFGKDLDLVKNVEIKFSEGYIDKISANVKTSSEPKMMDCLLVPGFINGHTHVGDSYGKEKGYGRTISEVVEPPNGIKHRILNTLPENDIISGMKNAINEMLSCGTTMFADYREGGIDGIYILKTILKDNPIKAFVFGRPYPSFDKLQPVLKMSNGLGLNSINLMPDNELEYSYLMCHHGQKIISTHVSETAGEREISLENHGMSDIQRAIEKYRAEYLIHCNYANDDDLELIAKNNVSIVVCPRSNFSFGLSLPPIDKMQDLNIPMCLGTDNVMINSPDLFREMEFLAKYSCQLNNPIAGKDILRMVTTTPASVLRLDHIMGYLTNGYRADFFLLDLSAPNLAPIDTSTLYESIVLRAKSLNVVATYVNGVPTYVRGI